MKEEVDSPVQLKFTGDIYNEAYVLGLSGCGNI